MAAQDLNNSFRLNLDNRRPLEVRFCFSIALKRLVVPNRPKIIQLYFRIESYVQSTPIIVDLHMRQNLFRSKLRAVHQPGLQ